MKLTRQITLLLLTAVLGGCFWGPGYHRDGGYDHGSGYDHGGGGYGHGEHGMSNGGQRPLEDQGRQDNDHRGY
ncbi:hypothetical protein OL229_16165 [Neisseriaceae bacterium JH1-16]|nr:hypothetical protein [Neisseriaceae bacterium JH1-16]